MTLEDLEKKQDISARDEMLKTSLDADKKRQEIFSDKKVLFALLGIPTVVFTFLSYVGNGAAAALFLVVSAIVVLALIFSRNVQIESIVERLFKKIK